MTATFSDDRALTVARGLLNQSVVLAFRVDAFLHRIDELQRHQKRLFWELEDFLLLEVHAQARPRAGLLKADRTAPLHAAPV